MLYQTKNPHGGDVYGQTIRLDYSSNTNPYGTPEGIIRAVQKALTQVHHYPDPYCRELVGAIARFEGVRENQILCGNGAAEVIYAYCEAVHPKTALELAPTFSEYALGLERVGCTMKRYTLRQENDFRLDRGFLDVLRREKPELVVLCSPNNPTGQPVDRDLLEDILALCREQGSRLFLDECFLDLSDHGRSMKNFLDTDPELFLLKAFTKSYGMAGLRLGYGLCGDPALLTAMSRTVQPWNVSTLAQAAGVAALQEQDFLARTKALIPVERAWLTEQLETLGFWVCPAQANYLLFRGPEGLDRALLPQAIAIRSCDNYHGLGKGWYRVAVRLPEENRELITAISRICGKEL